MFIFLLFEFLSILILKVSAFPDPGVWSKSYDKVESPIFGYAKPLYSGSSIYISVNCEPYTANQKIEVQWVLRQTACFEDSLTADAYNRPNHSDYFICPVSTNYSPQMRYFVSKPITLECSNKIQLPFTDIKLEPYSEKTGIPDLCPTFATSKYGETRNFSIISQNDILPQVNPSLLRVRKRTIDNSSTTNENAGAKDDSLPPSSLISNNTSIDTVAKKSTENEIQNRMTNVPTVKYESAVKRNDNDVPLEFPNDVKAGTKLATVDMDGIYLMVLTVKGVYSGGKNIFNISVNIAMKGDDGYLSAVDYPLLMFYGVMCILYIIFAGAWLIMSALQWRDLLRIQFWIGAVICLGLMEKAVFLGEYDSINYSGESVRGAILFAEILSCMKRTLARMLIIIVSLGFGIVKPRLGPMLHRIIGVGALYFCLGAIEGCLRVLKQKTDPSNQALMAGIPLAVTDSAICWWIFSSLVQTIRTLRLRRNIVKLQLYKHFTNALLCSVIGSVAFMTWSIHAHKLANCITDWKELWVDEAYWHFLFSVILFVIMILWRPTNNNQRYAFTPLLDAMDDDDDDEDEENHLANDAFVGMKMRTPKNNSNAAPKQDEVKKQDEDLKWVEENIPTSLTDVALPSLMDSDEEIMTAKFERSKME